jgi:Family of unknown function (DUF6084)
MSIETTPAPTFTVVGARTVPVSGMPAFELLVEVEEPSGAPVYTINLHTQVHLEPSRRTYDDASRERMVELFGPPERWSATTGSIPWLAVDTLVPSFTGRTTFPLRVPCGYDLEVAATRYCDALREGELPLDLHFNGTVFHQGDEGRLAIAMIPWAATARYALPVEVWRTTIDRHYPAGGWIALHRETLDRLTAYRAQHGLSSFTATVERLLGEEGPR